MKIYVISDLHLKYDMKPEDKTRLNLVLSFLDEIKDNIDVLIMNGDIFDLWYDWKRVIIKDYFPFLKKLADLKENGCRLIFIAGNHDFWFGNFLKDIIGIELYTDAFIEELDNKKLYFTHGDNHTKNDFKYKFFRTLIRNKIIMSVFHILHPDFSLLLGKQISRSSRDRKVKPELKKNKEKGLFDFAKHKLFKYDIVGLGHSHNPIIKEHLGKYYVNSGDWISHNSYIKIEDGIPSLHFFNNN